MKFKKNDRVVGTEQGPFKEDKGTVIEMSPDNSRVSVKFDDFENCVSIRVSEVRKVRN